MRGAEVKQLLSLNGVKQQSSSQLRYQSTDRIMLSPGHMYLAFRMLARSSNATNSTKYRCNFRGAKGEQTLLQYILYVKVVFWTTELKKGKQIMEVFSTRCFSGVKTQKKWKTCVQTKLPCD